MGSVEVTYYDGTSRVVIPTTEHNPYSVISVNYETGALEFSVPSPVQYDDLAITYEVEDSVLQYTQLGVPWILDVEVRNLNELA